MEHAKSIDKPICEKSGIHEKVGPNEDVTMGPGSEVGGVSGKEAAEFKTIESGQQAKKQQPLQQQQQAKEKEKELSGKGLEEQKVPEKTASKGGSGSVNVIDVGGAPTLTLSPEDVASKNVGWLRQQLCDRCPTMQAQGKGKAEQKILVFQVFDQWLEDDIQLKDLDLSKGIHWLRQVAHGDAPFSLSLRILPATEKENILQVSVLDSDTINILKHKIAAEHKISCANQRILFGGTLLEDHRTIQSYNIPAETTLDVDVIAI